MSGRFTNVGRFHRGYDAEQVDLFVDKALENLARPDNPEPLTALDIRRVGFAVRRGGYLPEDVDEFLEGLEVQVVARDRARLAHNSAAAGEAVVQLVVDSSAVKVRLGRRAGFRVARVRRFDKGYEVAQVDRYLDLVAAALDGGEGTTIGEIRAQQFRRRRHGYDEQAVDDLLDAAVDVMLRRKG